MESPSCFTPVTDTSNARSLLMLCFVHDVSSLKLVTYHDCHIDMLLGCSVSVCKYNVLSRPTWNAPNYMT